MFSKPIKTKHAIFTMSVLTSTYISFFIKKTIQQGPNKRKTCVPNLYTKTNFNSEISSVNITRKKRRQNHCSSHFILNNVHKIMDIYSVIIFFPSKRRKNSIEKKHQTRDQYRWQKKLQPYGLCSKGRNVTNISDKSPKQLCKFIQFFKNISSVPNTPILLAIFLSVDYIRCYYIAFACSKFTRWLSIYQAKAATFQHTVIKLMRYFSHSPSSQMSVTEN